MPPTVNRVTGSDFVPETFQNQIELIEQYQDEGALLPHDRLSEAFPDHFRRYCEHFIDYFKLSPYHTKTSYEFGWPQRKGKKRQQPLALIDGHNWDWKTSEVERHLDQQQWRWFQESHDRPCGRETEFFWLAQHAPRKISFHAIDADNKKKLGWVGEGTADSPATPVMTMPLSHFKNLKMIYDNFPNRIWCITSETLGLDIIQRHGLRLTDVVHAQTKRRLANIGLGATEVHPMSGRCKRRPFGEHYRTITADGVLPTWQNQLDYFEAPGATPAFRHIAMTLLSALEDQWSAWYSDRLNRRNNRIDVVEIIEEQRVIARNVEEWLDAGCPSGTRTQVAVANQIRHQERQTTTTRRSSVASSFDSEQLRGGRWAPTLEKIARNGLPAEDCLGELVFEMAKYLWWIELFDLEEEQRHQQVVDLLCRFVFEKHNGMSSRINEGNMDDVLSQVARCVVSASSLNVPYPDRSEKLFARIRNKRVNGEYLRPINLAPIIEGSEQPQDVNTYSLLSTLFSVTTLEELHGQLSDPLPESILEMIKPHSGRIRLENHTTRFLNLLYKSEQGEFIRLNRDELSDQNSFQQTRQDGVGCNAS